MLSNSVNSLSFQAKLPVTVTKFYVPGKDNSTLRCFVTTKKNSVTEINYTVLKKHGVETESKTYRNKKGFNDERIGSICKKIQEKVKEGCDFLIELMNAQYKEPN